MQFTIKTVTLGVAFAFVLTLLGIALWKLIRSVVKKETGEQSTVATNVIANAVNVGMLILALIGGGLYTWLDNSDKRNDDKQPEIAKTQPKPTATLETREHYKVFGSLMEKVFKRNHIRGEYRFDGNEDAYNKIFPKSVLGILERTPIPLISKDVTCEDCPVAYSELKLLISAAERFDKKINELKQAIKNMAWDHDRLEIIYNELRRAELRLFSFFSFEIYACGPQDGFNTFREYELKRLVADLYNEVLKFSLSGLPTIGHELQPELFVYETLLSASKSKKVDELKRKIISELLNIVQLQVLSDDYSMRYDEIELWDILFNQLIASNHAQMYGSWTLLTLVLMSRIDQKLNYLLDEDLHNEEALLMKIKQRIKGVEKLLASHDFTKLIWVKASGECKSIKKLGLYYPEGIDKSQSQELFDNMYSLVINNPSYCVSEYGFAALIVERELSSLTYNDEDALNTFMWLFANGGKKKLGSLDSSKNDLKRIVILYKKLLKELREVLTPSKFIDHYTF